MGKRKGRRERKREGGRGKGEEGRGKREGGRGRGREKREKKN